MQQQAIADPYWSRTEVTGESVDREDPVIWHDEGRAEIEVEQRRAELNHFERKGFRHAPALFSEVEAAQILAEAKRLADEVEGPRPGVVVEPGSKAVRSLFRLHQYNDVFQDVAKDPRLVEFARQVLGSEVYVHQSRINFKPAFNGKEFFWHSDFETWHVEDGMPRMRAMSVSISLTDNNEFNGPLMVVPGSHTTYVRCVGATPENHFEHSLKKQEYGVPSLEAMRQLVDRGGIVAPKGRPGSALFFDCNLMHGSAGNLSPYPRTNLFIVFNSVENGVTAPFGGMRPRPDFLSERDIVPVSKL
jgi:ectoine hydroxylase